MRLVQFYKGWKIIAGMEMGKEFYLAYSIDSVETLGADTLSEIKNKIRGTK